MMNMNKEAYMKTLVQIQEKDPALYAITLARTDPDDFNSSRGIQYHPASRRIPLTDSDTVELTTAMQNNSYITMIDFSHNNLTDKSIPLLANLSLEKLWLNGNPIEDKNSILLLAENSTLTHLRIWGDKLFFDKECAEAFMKNNRIVELIANFRNLDGNLHNLLTQHVEKNKQFSARLITAAANANIEEVSVLLKEGAYIESKDEIGNTALISACWHQREETAKLLIAKGANVNARNYKEGVTLLGDSPLHAVAKRGNKKLALLLLNNGANKNILNLEGRTPAEVARKNKHYELENFIKTYTPSLSINYSLSKILMAPPATENILGQQQQIKNQNLTPS